MARKTTPAGKKKSRKSGKPKPWTSDEISEAFRRFRKAMPEPRTELQSLNPFTLLVAVVLSAQATDAGVNKATPALFAAADTPEKMVALGEERVRDFIKTIGLYRGKAKNVVELSRRLVAVVLSAQATDAGVNKATPALFAAADTPEKMAALGEERVQDLIKTIGLYRTKAKNVVALSQQLVSEHGGAVPRTREALEALPGVGRKTANVVLNVAFGEPTIAVDTHIFRVGNRTGMATGKTPFEVEIKLDEVVPAKYKLHAHHWLILHGRYVCVARRPLCEKCLIADLCKWPAKTVSQ